jgi:hypothetical protein
MTAELAHEYIRRRMDELGHGSNYHIRFRHFNLKPTEQRKVEGNRQLFILTEPNGSIRVQSEMGVFDLTDTTANELQYEHQGTIGLTNYSQLPQQVKMIQLIFKNK